MIYLDHGNIGRLVVGLRALVDLVLLEHSLDLRHAWPTLILFVQQLLGIHKRVVIRLVETLR